MASTDGIDVDEDLNKTTLADIDQEGPGSIPKGSLEGGRSRQMSWRRNSESDDDNDSLGTYLSRRSSSSLGSSVACSALVSLGVPNELAVVAVELWSRGVDFAGRKVVRIKAKFRDRLTRLRFRDDRPREQKMTVMITGEFRGEDTFSAELEMGEYNKGTTISNHHLLGIRKLIVGKLGITVKDLGGYTRGTSAPYAVVIPLDAVIAIVQANWKYVRISKYETRSSSYTIMKIRPYASRRDVFRLVWDNNGSLSRSRAVVYSASEWERTPYRKKSVEQIGATDLAIMLENQGRMLAFDTE